MSQVIKGFVKKLSVKEGRGRRGPWKLYSARVELDSGEEFEHWISFGFDEPKVKEGDYVKITASENDRGYLQADEVKALKNAPARSGGSATAAPSGNVSTTQRSIHYQSSRKDAIEVLKLLTSQDALPLSSAKTKAGEAKRYDEIMALVDKLTVRFFNDAETQRILAVVADEGKVDTKVGALPDDSDDEEEEASDDEEEFDDDAEDDE